MRSLIPLLLAAALVLPGVATASNGTSTHQSTQTKWALFGVGSKHVKKVPKASKAAKASHSKKAGKASHRAKSKR